jgi:hypothetical protein
MTLRSSNNAPPNLMEWPLGKLEENEKQWKESKKILVSQITEEVMFKSVFSGKLIELIVMEVS